MLDVTVIALESPEEIPADPEEIAEAEAEGIEILYRKGPHRFVGADGRVTGLETIDVRSVFDDDGRFNPTFVPDTYAVLPADTVILAVGQAADLEVLAGVELELSRGWHPGRSDHHEDLARPHLGRWRCRARPSQPHRRDGRRAAGGSRRSTPSSPVCAAPPGGVHVELHRRPTFRRLSTSYDAIERQPVPATPTARRIGFAEVEVGYDADDAWLQSLRCLRCFDNVMLEPSLCILCGLCVDVCPTNCITIARADEIGLGEASQSVLLLGEDLCIRCGLCVNRCPPGALSMVHAREVCRWLNATTEEPVRPRPARAQDGVRAGSGPGVPGSSEATCGGRCSATRPSRRRGVVRSSRSRTSSCTSTR